MITEKMKQLMQQIKELDPDYEFLTEEDIEECKKEDPNFEITEESLEADLREYLPFLQVLPEMIKIAEMDMNVRDDKVQSNLIEVVD